LGNTLNKKAIEKAKAIVDGVEAKKVAAAKQP